MNSLLASLLILVPAPIADEQPTGPAPSLQFVKWNLGTFEMTVTVTKAVPVTKTIVVNVNGRKESRNVTTYEYVQEIRKESLDVKGAEVFGLDGKKIDETTWQKALGSGAVVALTREGQLPHSGYLRVLKEGTLIVVFKPAMNPLLGPITVPSPNAPKR
jgi:hypothetical protein